MICVGTGDDIGSDPVVTVIDPATNVTTGIVDLTIDNMNPLTPTITSPISGSYLATDNVTVT